MEPITIILTAIVAGAALKAKDIGEKAIDDLYHGLKTLIVDRYHAAEEAVEQIEKNPESETRKALAREVLEENHVEQDANIVHQAQALLAAVAENPPAAAQEAGIDMERIRAGASVNIEDIISTSGSHIGMRDIEAGQNVTIKGVHAQGKGDTDPKS